MKGDMEKDLKGDLKGDMEGDLEGRLEGDLEDLEGLGRGLDVKLRSGMVQVRFGSGLVQFPGKFNSLELDSEVGRLFPVINPSNYF